MTRQLDLILKEGGATYDWQVDFEVQSRYLDARCKFWLSTVLEDLGGKGSFPLFEKVPVDFIKKIILRLEGKRQKTINIERLLDQGVEPDEIEDAISRQLMKLDDEVVGIEFILNVKSIADAVQPETDNLLRGL